MASLTNLGAAVGALLMQRRQTLAVAESSAGGLINAARQANLWLFATRAIDLLGTCMRKCDP